MWKLLIFIVLHASAFASPTKNMNSNLASFLEKPTDTILSSIADRLHNLEVFYSMHLSPILEDKLEQHNRKLEALDTKLIKLESLFTLNLDKISENISTKNYKDDISRTNTYRKIDTMYESISHRLSYMDRKLENNFVKTQALIESAQTKLDKMEQGVSRRHSDLETEISDAIFAIDDLKSAHTSMEENLIIAIKDNIINETLKNQKHIIQILNETQKTDNNTIVETLKSINSTVSLFMPSTMNESNRMMDTFKTELRKDLNEYANKVADMNSDVWKTNTILKDMIKSLETKINSTNTEILVKHIEKFLDNDNSYNSEDVNNKMDINFEKIITNQEMFLESCHRLQMDEAQIENEISDILKKLVTMLDQKKSIEIKDIKNLEKLIKTHDNHIYRNLNQANTNIVSLFDKTGKNENIMENDLKKILKHFEELFSILKHGNKSSTNVKTVNNVGGTHDFKLMERRIISSIESKNVELKQAIALVGMKSQETNTNSEFNEYIKKSYNILNNVKICEINTNNSLKIENTIDDPEIKKLIDDIFAPDPNLMTPEIFNTPTETISKKPCKQNYSKLIDIRTNANDDCEMELTNEDSTEELELNI